MKTLISKRGGSSPLGVIISLVLGLILLMGFLRLMGFNVSLWEYLRLGLEELGEIFDGIRSMI